MAVSPSDLLVLAGMAVSLGLSALALTRSVPATVRKQARRADEIAAQLESEWTRARADLGVIVERMEDVAETIEKRRARVAAANQRAAEAANSSEPADIRHELRRRAGLI